MSESKGWFVVMMVACILASTLSGTIGYESGAASVHSGKTTCETLKTGKIECYPTSTIKK